VQRALGVGDPPRAGPGPGLLGWGRLSQPLDGKRNGLAGALPGRSTGIYPAVVEKEICGNSEVPQSLQLTVS